MFKMKPAHTTIKVVTTMVGASTAAPIARTSGATTWPNTGE